MSPDQDPSLIQDFLAEAGELIEHLDTDLVALEAAGAGPEATELLNRIFRALHTVKGAAGFLNLQPLIRFAHAAEDALNHLRKGTVALTPAVFDALLRSVDVLRSMIDELGQGRPITPCPSELTAKLEAIAASAQTPQAPATEPAKAQASAPLPAPEPAASPAPAAPAATNDQPGEQVAPLSLPDQKRDLLSFFAADLRESGPQIAHCVEQARSEHGRTDAGSHLAEIAQALQRTAVFFELAPLQEVARVTELIAAHLGEVTDNCADELLIRLSALRVLVERQADALDRNEALTWPLQTFTGRVEQLLANHPLAADLANAHGGDVQRLLEVDGIMGPGPLLSSAATSPAATSAPAAPTAPAAAAAQPTAVDHEPTAKAGEAAPDPRAANQGAAAEQTIRVEVNRLEALLNLVGQMVLNKNRVLALSRKLQEQDLIPELQAEAAATANDLDRLTATLQVAVMRTRMQPLAKLFDRYPRVIRDIARSTDKQIRLEVIGKETEVDKSVLELLADPLVHLLRNSADHGVEAPDKRQKTGKESTGTIRLMAEHKGSHVRVAVSDDGKGIDREVIGRKAVEKGLYTAEQIAAMSDSDVLNIIFQAGFSTAENVSDLSGRGVGLDVVRTNVQKMNGSINVHSQPGAGSTFEILIPLTVAIIPAMVLGIGEAAYCVPTQAILEIVRPEPGDVHTVAGQPVMRLRQTVLPLIDMRRRVGASTQEPARFALVVSAGEQRAGLLVDRLIGQQDIVIKPLAETCSRGGCFSGATIQENGQVSLILDVMQLIRQTQTVGERKVA